MLTCSDEDDDAKGSKDGMKNEIGKFMREVACDCYDEEEACQRTIMNYSSQH